MMERTKVLERLNEIFQDVFDNEELVINDASCAENVEGWDSLRHITLISAVEKAFGMKFAMKEVLEMENVGAMADILAARATK